MNQLAVVVAEERGGGRLRNSHLKISRIQISQSIQRDAVGRGSRRRVCSITGRGTHVGINVRLQLHAGAGRRIDAESAALIAADLHDRHVNDYFGLGLIKIVYKFFGKRNLIGRTAHNNGAF